MLFCDFLVTVEPVVNPRTTSPTAIQVLLLCIMRDYIRPDSQFKWFRDDDELVLGDKYSVVYADGPLLAQNGMETRSPSRFAGLFIANPNTDDAGSYTCGVNGAFTTVELIVDNPSGRS